MLGGFILVNRMRYHYIFIMLAAMILILSACQQKNSAEDIYNVLEKTAKEEKGFADQQDPLVNLERQEKTTYDKVIGLGMKQYNQIVRLSDSAISMADQRKIYIEKETESIHNSEKEFKKLIPLKDAIKDEKLKKEANELYTIMMNRYKAHDDLYKAYIKSIADDKQLYEMFKDKVVSIDKLEAQINKVNSDYKEIYADNESFNKRTKEFNDKKIEFYNMAGLKAK